MSKEKMKQSTIEKQAKDIVRRILAGSLNDELEIAEKEQQDKELQEIVIEIDEELLTKLNEKLNESSFSIEAFVSVCLKEYIKLNVK